MNWKTEMQVRDLGPAAKLNATCPACGYKWLEPVEDLAAIILHANMYIDEAEQCLSCPNCRSVGVDLVLANEMRPSAFVAGRA